jgi:hypothetical protein
MASARDSAGARRLRLREHPIEQPAAMPRLDWVENEFGAILLAYDSCHGWIIAGSGRS